MSSGRALQRVRARVRHGLPSFAVVAVVALAAGCGSHAAWDPIGHTAQAVTVCSSTASPALGVDVSVFQGTVDWSQVKAAGMTFAIARISDGTFLDTQFSANWSGMQTAGLVRGAYQYFEPGEDPAMQASIVVSAVGMLGAGDLPVTADMETTGSQSAATIVANLQTWAEAVQAGTGKAPMIYTAEGYWDSDVASSAFASNPLWVANWQVSCPDLPSAWSAWQFWQNADNGTVNGISGSVDTDQFNGTVAELQAAAGGMPTGGPEYAATYVSQSWPLATTTMMMTTCQTMPASITFKNTGTKSWDSFTRLATTQPRDRVSELADSTWVSDNRLAQVSGTVAPGATYEFKFDFHAPPTAASFDEFYGLVEDGVAWFSDPGQGGPPDDDIEAKIQVTGSMGTCTVDPGVPTSAPGADGGAAADATTPTPDASPSPDAAIADASLDAPSSLDTGAPLVLEAGFPTGPDASVDAGRTLPGEAPAPAPSRGGCSCELGPASPQPQGDRPVATALALGAVVLTRSRSRRRRKRS